VLTAFVLQHVAAIAALQGSLDKPRSAKKLELAAMLLGFVEARLRSLGAHRDHTERQEQARGVATLQSVFGERLNTLTALGAQWSEESVAAAALEL
jgi:hypothetical protein